VSKIDRYGEKLSALYFSRTYEEKVEDCKTQIESLVRAAQEVRTSDKLKAILELVLALGNYMNTGARAGAYGFKLNTLLKVRENTFLLLLLNFGSSRADFIFDDF
jgi:dishevelled associated activator of morphogenesis